MYRRFAKRWLDFSLAAGAALLLSPLLGLVGLLIALEDGPPVIYRQKRVGKGGETFTLLKFRSMPVSTPTLTSVEGQALRVNRVGRLIRRLNIDELPQLLNILRGEMSLVGPRPALPTQTDLLAARRDLQVLAYAPGLTGLAQVRSFDGMSPYEKAEWDAEYVKNISFGKDIRILMETLHYLCKRPPTY
jgi:lipopolysaccharide/colanic/teichoic acid biosynthesis glycosyltransferase